MEILKKIFSPKGVLCIFVIVVISHFTYSQSSEQHVVSSSGGYISNSNGQVSWTFGDLIISTITSTDGIITQGFQQSLLDIGYGVEIIKSLNEGWTWFSLNVTDTDMSLGTVLTNLTLTKGDYIKNQTTSATYYDDYGWFGELTELDEKETYKIKLGSSGELQYTGQPIDPSKTSIPIKTGWNWIGYLPQGTISTEASLASINPIVNDYIKNQTQSATFYDESGWFGALMNMEALDGFMLKVGQDGMLSYPVETAEVKMDSDDSWLINYESIIKDTLNPANFEYSGQVTAEVLLNGEIVGNEGDVLITMSNGNLVGQSKPRTFPPSGLPLFIHLTYENSKENSQLHFYYYKSDENQWYSFEETLAFKSDMIESDAYNPFRLEKASKTENPLSPNNPFTQSISIYPNPATTSAMISLELDHSQDLDIEVLDVYGRVVMKKEANVFQSGENTISIDLRRLNNGVYFIRLLGSPILLERFIIAR